MLTGAFFKQKRLEKGLSKEELTAILNCREDYVEEIEDYERNISTLDTIRLCEGLGIPKIEALVLQGTLTEKDAVEFAASNAEKFTIENIRKEQLRLELYKFSGKEKEIMSAVVSPLYFSDSSDYKTGLWDVLRVLFEGKLEISDSDVNKLYALLNPEEEEEEED